MQDIQSLVWGLLLLTVWIQFLSWLKKHHRLSLREIRNIVRWECDNGLADVHRINPDRMEYHVNGDNLHCTYEVRDFGRECLVEIIAIRMRIPKGELHVSFEGTRLTKWRINHGQDLTTTTDIDWPLLNEIARTVRDTVSLSSQGRTRR